MLLVELFDELVFGAWSAAWPAIRDDLDLSYAALGLLFALPHVFASVLEAPLGLLGDAWDRRRLVHAGGAAFVAGLLLVASSGGFASLLVALLLIFPASGAFVSLSQATLMDAAPEQRELNMARWTLAGAIGVLAGPLFPAASAAAGWGWRGAFLALAAVGAVALALAWPVQAPRTAPARDPLVPALADAARDAWRALRRRDVLRPLALIQLADLMLDVLHGVVALYFVDVAGASAALAALAVVVYTAAGLAGEVMVIALLARTSGSRYLRSSVPAALLAYIAFLLVDAVGAKLVLLGAVALATAGWYSVLKAGLYRALPERSASVMALESVSGLVGGLLPLGLGLAAERFGLGAAMWLLAAGPLALLIGLLSRSPS